MTLESMKKEAKKKAQMRDEEHEDVRCNSQKKVKALEAQLNHEHDERTLLLREKHELERRLSAAAEPEHHDRVLQRLKRNLKRMKALLRNTQTQLDRKKAETQGDAVLAQLCNQLEDVKCTRTMTFKAKQGLEGELLRMQSWLHDAHGQKKLAKLKKFKDTGQQMSLVSKLRIGKN